MFLVFILTCLCAAPVAKESIFLAEQTSKKVDPFLPLMPRKGDVSSIQKYGRLRVIYTGENITKLESDLLDDFATSYRVKITYISIKNLIQGQSLLKLGLADVLLGNSDSLSGLSKSLPIRKGTDKSLSWSVRTENSDLKNAINHIITYFYVSESSSKNYQEDLDKLKKRKILRVVTKPHPQNYFLKRGVPVGFEYELLQRFAEKHKLWLEVLIAENEKEMLDWIKTGKADIATVVSVDPFAHGADASLPFYPTHIYMVTRKTEKNINDLYDISGREIALLTKKYHFKGVDYLTDKGIQFSTVEPGAKQLLSKKLQRVLTSEYDIAMVSSKSFMKQKDFHKDLKVIATLNERSLNRWAVNINNNKLKLAINEFFAHEFKGQFYNVIYRRYHRKTSTKERIEFDYPLNISPYDNLVKKYADKYRFDWRLVLAQMYQESQFRPDALSASGAKGLMQIMPKTAKEMHVSDVSDPESGINAGVKYMKKLRDRYDDYMAESERNWFALASYNAGYERIEDARKFAEFLGHNPDRWFENVEYAMEALAKPENRKHTRFGFCRCEQTVVYLRSIRKLYHSYIQLSDPKLAINYDLEPLILDNKLGLLYLPH